MKKVSLTLLIGLLVAACSQPETTPKQLSDSSELDGKKLMEKNCFVCHNTQGTDNMLAPPMSRVKDHYWDEENSREEFVSDIVNWVENPTEENSYMPGALRKFGLMPKQAFDKKEVTAIAEYLFDNEITMESCH